MIYRPDRGAYVVTGLVCVAASGAGLAVYLLKSEELGLYTLIAGLITWVLLWGNLAGQRVEVTPLYIEKTRAWFLRRRIPRSEIARIARGTNPITDGPYTIAIVGRDVRIKINLKLYPIELVDAIGEMT